MLKVIAKPYFFENELDNSIKEGIKHHYNDGEHNK